MTARDEIPLRDADQVMRLSRMGSFHQSRLSFMRILLRRMRNENWQFDAPDWHVNENGVGRAVYTVHGPSRAYSLVAFAHDLPDEMRSDRVIATAWDTTFTLFDGIPTDDDIARLAQNVPLQEAGRISVRELTLSRANRSARLWDFVVANLSAGRQPDPESLKTVGYVMRTTAVYGSGKFGAADHGTIQDRPEFAAPFQAEMLTVYLIRCFVMDLLDHNAKCAGGKRAVKLSPKLRRALGIGNSTGLGMAPFLVNHPTLLHQWIAARETALARVRGIKTVTDGERDVMIHHAKSAHINAMNWHSQHPMQIAKVTELQSDMVMLCKEITRIGDAPYPWDRLYRWAAQNLTSEGLEQVVSILMEPYGDVVDDLADAMSIDESAHFYIDGTQAMGHVKSLIAKHFDWALKTDFGAGDEQARFWYVSAAKLEPRLGERDAEQGHELEQPLAIGRDVAALYRAITQDETVAHFLRKHPEHRHILRRVQMVEKFPYAEIRDNLLHAQMMPIDMLRCKLSFFGATHFDPRSDRWLRICMFQNAPFPDELYVPGNWVYPEPTGAI
ncbi:hypothetical protein GCM10008927_06890 [Amylibacter ulvae]|uniref:Uncharacterized protein n=1 Tax=Paramylibacter ulvae TaxID=1651968 RepID=A0ABQ3CUN5_9RHOB|nr:hypothetical protein [Amylibacter ulvae]GHA44653.1 hypothetical protein GCM10008927_06890 [Amylibacter ulvae]